MAYITLADGAVFSEEDLRDACSQFLVNYKMPGRIEILDKLPLTPAGKVDRMALRKRARAGVSD